MVHEVLELCCFEWFQNMHLAILSTGLVLELCCFEWFQNLKAFLSFKFGGFRAVLFRMVPKQSIVLRDVPACFRAVLFRMVPKPLKLVPESRLSF